MDTEKFWSMIEDARQQSQGSPQRQSELLLNSLLNLSEQEIQEFDYVFWAMKTRAYRADLWEVVSLIACYCGDDGFDEFRNWLIMQGQVAFEKALEDPENLADIVEINQRLNIFDLSLTLIIMDAYEQKTGQMIPGSYPLEHILIGEPLAPDEERPAKFPRIAAKFGECDDVLFG